MMHGYEPIGAAQECRHCGLPKPYCHGIRPLGVLKISRDGGRTWEYRADKEMREWAERSYSRTRAANSASALDRLERWYRLPSP